MPKSYKLENFTPTDHFRERALERFGIKTDEELFQFIQDNNEVYDSGLAPTSNRESTLSRQGNMFILDTINNKLVTVYKSISPAIAERKKDEFQAKLNMIIRESQVSTAKDYLSEIRENIQRFYLNAMNLINEQEESLMYQISNPEIEFNKIEDIYKDMTIIRSTLNLLSKQTNFYEQHKLNYESNTKIEENQQWSPTQSMSLDEFKDSNYEIKTADLKELPKADLKELPKTEPFFPNYKLQISNKSSETNLPENYKPKVSNNDLISDKDILKDYLEGPDRVIINNWFSKQGKSPLGSQVNKAIQSGYTQTQLESLVKPQLSIIHFNKFKNILKNTLKDAKKRKGVK